MSLKPKLFTSVKNYDRSALLADLLAGSVVGVVAIPLALAFAIASGVSPEKGLYTAIVAGFLISALGGSRVQIGGPTGAFVVIVYDIVTKHGLDGLAACTLMAGAILVVMGLCRMGALIKFIPYPLITGFTSGIAAIIFSAQIKDLMGLKMAAVPPGFVEKWAAYASAAGTAQPATAGLAFAVLVFLWLWPRVSHKIPGPVVALVAGTIAAQALGLDVETIGARFGSLPRGLPAPSLPNLPWGHMRELLRPAITVALLAAIESLLSAVVADGMIGGRHRSNAELIAQGVANLASPLFGGIPATGAIARTATNVKCGGRTPVAGMVHALTLLLALLLLGPWIERVPLCVLASILVIVAYHMSEWRSFASLLKAPRSDAAVMIVTFLLTVFVDLTVAVEVGLVLSSFLFMRRMADVTQIDAVRRELADADGEPVKSEAEHIPAGVEVYRINGPFFFGAAGKLRSVMDQIQRPPKVFILQMSDVPVMDATGLRALQDFQARCRRAKVELVLSGLAAQPQRVIAKAGVAGDFDHVLHKGGLRAALALAAKLADGR